MKTVIIVQARMTSTRLPGKVMMPLAGRPMLDCLLERLRRVKLANQVVVATTTNTTDDVVAQFCEGHAVAVYRGSEQDVLSRYAEAAQEHAADIVVRVTSDCPLLDPQLVDDVIGAFQPGANAYDYASNMLEPTYPYGMAVEVFSSGALMEAYREANQADEREHVTPFIYWRPDRYRLKSVKWETDLSHQRWTVDTPEDYELVRRIYERVYPFKPEFGLADVLELMDLYPDWVAINQHIVQIKPTLSVKEEN